MIFNRHCAILVCRVTMHSNQTFLLQISIKFQGPAAMVADYRALWLRLSKLCRDTGKIVQKIPISLVKTVSTSSFIYSNRERHFHHFYIHQFIFVLYNNHIDLWIDVTAIRRFWIKRYRFDGKRALQYLFVVFHLR